MTDTQVENSGSFSDPSQAARLRDLLNGLIEDRVKALSPTRMTGMVLDIYQGGPTFNSDITVDSTIIPRTQDNPERPYVAKIRLDDKFEGGIVEARIDPNLIPIFRKADFFDEENPAGSGTMVDRAGRYITVEVTDDGSAPVDDTYPSLIGTTLQAPQAAPRVALVGSAASWRVSELIRGVLAIQTNPATLMLGPDYARFDTNTLTWGGTIAFARGSEIKAYEIYPDAPIVTYGSEPLEVSPTEPVEIVLGQRSGSMYLNFSATDGVPVLVWVEAGSDTPIPPEWYLVFARINDGDLSSKLVFSSLTDFRSPGAPDNLVLTYAKTGYEKLGLTASWDEVTEGTNGDPISISGYELWGMLDDEDWRRITTTTDTHVAGLTFDSSSEWHFKVRAVGANGIPGVFSTVEAVTFPDETEVIGGGSKTYWQDTKPTEGHSGDEWFDTANGNAHYIFDDALDDYIFAPYGGQAIADAAIGDAKINNLNVSKLTGGTLQADISLAAKIEAGTSGLGLVTLDATGIRVTDGSGIQQTAFNTTGQSVFKGDIEAAGIEAKGKVKLNAANNEIAVNASLTLAAGVTAPASAPQVTYTWNSFGVPAPTGALSWETSFSHHARGTDGKWYFYTYNYDVASMGILRFRVHRYSAALAWEAVVIDVTSNPPTTDGGVGYLTALMSTSVAVVNGVVWVPRIKMTRVSSTSYTLQHQLYSSGGASIDVGTAYTGYNPSLSIYSMPTSQCIIGNASATQVAMIFGQMAATAPTTQSIRLFNVSTGAITNSFTIADTNSAAIIFGQFDYGDDRYVITRDIDASTYTYDWRIRTFTTAGVVEPARDFVVGGTTVLAKVPNSLGISYYNGTFWTATGPGSTSNMMNVFQHSTIAASEVYAFSWYDSKSAGTGVHESAISPTFTASDLRYIRAIARVTTTQFAPDLTDDGVDKVRIYAGATEATLKVQVDSSVNQVDLSTITTSGSAPGSNPDFGSASGNPALITNPAGTLLIKADGTIVGMIDAGALTTGTLAVARIPSLPADQITSGTFAAARLPAATESAIGAVELATQAETLAGTDTTRAVTPANLLAAISAWPRCAAQSTTNLSLAANYTRIVGLTELYDNDGRYTPATGFYVTPDAGVYLIQGGICFTTASTRRFLQLETGTAAAGSNTSIARVEGVATAYSSLIVSREINLAAGVSVAMVAYAAAATTTNGSFAPNWFSIRRVA